MLLKTLQFTVVFLVTSSIRGVVASDVFISPRPGALNDDYSDNPTWLIGSTQRITWQDTTSEYNMSLFQENSEGNAARRSTSAVYGKSAVPSPC